MKRLMTAWLLVLCVSGLNAQSVVQVACQPGLEKYYALVQAVYAKMGLTCVFDPMPAERALVEVDSGNSDAEIGRTAGLEPNYRNIVYTTEPLVMTGVSGWALPGTADALTLRRDLNKFTFGLLRGNKSSETFVADQHLQADSFETIESLSKMLTSGRIQVALLPDAIDASVLAAVAVKVDVGAKRYAVFHLFSAKRKELAAGWDQALRAMKADGSYFTYLKGP